MAKLRVFETKDLIFCLACICRAVKAKRPINRIKYKKQRAMTIIAVDF